MATGKDNLFIMAEMNLPQFEKLDKEKTLFILPVGALEVHGRHLTNNADMVAAEMIADYSGNLFADKHRDWNVVILPLLNIGTDELPLPGSINFSRSTVYRALADYGRALHKWGFKNLALTTAHGGLAHNIALDDACRTSNRKYNMKMISPSTLVYQAYIYGQKFPEMERELGRKLTDAEKTGLIDMEHAAGWETSIMLAKCPELVSPDYKKLKATNIQLSPFFKKFGQALDGIIRKLPFFGGMLKHGGVTFDESLRLLKIYHRLFNCQEEEELNYCGDPSIACAEIGRAWEAALSKDMVSLYEDVFINLNKKPNEALSPHSALYILRREFFVVLAWLGIAAAVTLLIFIHV